MYTLGERGQTEALQVCEDVTLLSGAKVVLCSCVDEKMMTVALCAQLVEQTVAVVVLECPTVKGENASLIDVEFEATCFHQHHSSHHKTCVQLRIDQCEGPTTSSGLAGCMVQYPLKISVIYFFSSMVV